jgi:uncharacterized protein involved in exopolysaccharide biosynthesis
MAVENATDRPMSVDPFSTIPSAAELEDSSLDLIELYRMLRHRKATVIKVTLGFLVIAIVLAFSLPQRYTSSASFIPPTLNTGNSIASALAGQISAIGGTDLLGTSKSPGELYGGILKSRSIAADLVSRFNLIHVYGVSRESKAQKVLADHTTLSIDPKSTIVTVSVTERDPALAHNIADAYLDALRATEGRLALGQSSQRRLFYEQQLTKEKNNLADAEVELKKSQEQSGLIAPVGQTEVEIRRVAEIRAQIAARQVQLAALRQSATEQNPDMIRLNSEIADLQGQLSRLQTGDAQSENAGIPTSQLPQAQLDFVRKQREVKYHEALFEILAKQYEAARLDEAHDAPVLQILDPASTPDTPSFPRKGYVIVAGLFIGFIVGCVWAVSRDSIGNLYRRITAIR